MFIVGEIMNMVNVELAMIPFKMLFIGVPKELNLMITLSQILNL